MGRKNLWCNRGKKKEKENKSDRRWEDVKRRKRSGIENEDKKKEKKREVSKDGKGKRVQ